MLAGLATILLTGALASASAYAALPEFTNAPDTLKVTNVFVQEFVTVGGRGMTCGKRTGSGSISGAKSISATLTLTECKGIHFNTNKCHSTGAKEGEVKTAELEGTPVYIGTKYEVGLVLKRAGAGNLLEATCGSGAETETLKLKGSVIGSITPTNVATNEFGLVVEGRANEKGVQRYTEYENDKGEKVKAILEAEGSGKEGFAFEQAAEWDGFGTALAATNPAVLEAGGMPLVKPSPSEVSPITFTGHAGSTRFQKRNRENWLFSSGQLIGEFSGPSKVLLESVLFREGTPHACVNSESDLLVKAMSGKIGYLSKGQKRVGMLLNWEHTKCESNVLGALEYTGAVIANVEPVDTLTKKLTVTLKQIEAVQEFEKFEGESVLRHLEVKSSGTEEPIGFESTIELEGFQQGGKAVEVKIEA